MEVNKCNSHIRNYNKLFIFCFLVVLFYGCTSNGSSTEITELSPSEKSIAKSDSTNNVDKKASKIEDKVPLISEPVLINLKVEITADVRAKVIGSTNLPNSSNLLISISNPSLGKVYQDNVSVNAGKFSSVLGEKEGLNYGKYNVQIIFSPIAQSEEVKRIIGQRGENLIGANVSTSKLLKIKVAEAKTTFSIGSPKDIATSEKNIKERSLIIYNKLRKLIVESRAMNSLRQRTDLEGLAECGRQMRKLQSQAGELDNEAQALPDKYLALRIAAREMTMGVTCHQTMASDATNRADNELRDVSILFN